MNDLIQNNIDSLRELCQKHNVRTLSIFGSAVRDDFDQNTSDLDFCVEFQPREPKGFNDVYFLLLIDLEDLFDRRIDLVEKPVIEQSKNPFRRDAILNTLQPLYAAA